MAAPVNTAIPTTSGLLAAYALQTGTDGEWTGATSFAYKWQRAAVVWDGGAVTDDGEYVIDGWEYIDGATSQTYAATPDDLYSLLRLEVKASNVDGSTFAYSEESELIAGASASAGAYASLGASVYGGIGGMLIDEEEVEI